MKQNDFLCACNGKACSGECREEHLNQISHRRDKNGIIVEKIPVLCSAAYKETSYVK
jgi:hypothetical protein